METFFQGFIVAFREGLEAFLIVMILLQFLAKTKNAHLKKNVWQGLFLGIFASLLFGALLIFLSTFLGNLDTTAKMWESAASLVAVALIATFIKWMIDHGAQIKKHIEDEAAMHLSKIGILLIAFFMVAREGAEIALFQFAGKYPISSIFAGLALSIGLVILIHYSLVRVKLQTIFSITLVYLILQAGFLLGYSVHEGLSASKDLGLIAKESPIYLKAFDLSGSLLDHKEGALGLFLYVAIGWYSRPEWIQFILQYALTLGFFWYWYSKDRGLAHSLSK